MRVIIKHFTSQSYHDTSLSYRLWAILSAHALRQAREMIMGREMVMVKSLPDLDCALTIHNFSLATGIVRGDSVPVDPGLPSVKGDFCIILLKFPRFRHQWHLCVLKGMWTDWARNIISTAHFWLLLYIEKTISDFQQSAVIAVFENRLSSFSRESKVVCFCQMEAKAICLTVI